MYFLSIQDFDSADLILLHLEKCNTGAFPGSCGATQPQLFCCPWE
jgi:hypothetical protein